MKAKKTRGDSKKLQRRLWAAVERLGSYEAVIAIVRHDPRFRNLHRATISRWLTVWPMGPVIKRRVTCLLSLVEEQRKAKPLLPHQQITALMEDAEDIIWHIGALERKTRALQQILQSMR